MPKLTQHYETFSKTMSKLNNFKSKVLEVQLRNDMSPEKELTCKDTFKSLQEFNFDQML